MENLKGKLVFISGASSGIGKASAIEFAKLGCNLILAARRLDKLEILAEELKANYKINTVCIELDVRHNVDVEKAIDTLPDAFKAIDILLNSAGLARGMVHLEDLDTQYIDEVIDTNVKGLLYLTRKILKGMVQRNSGHIINLGSIAGHEGYPGGHIYNASKFAVRGLSDAIRMDTVDKNIRVSSIDPGMVNTDFSTVRFFGDREKADNVYKGIDPLLAEDIADAIIFIATRKARVNINEMIIMPDKQASALVNYKKS